MTIHMNLSAVTTEYTITDGDEFVVWVADFPAVYPTREAASECMRALCWHVKRHAGSFRVEQAQVARSKWGTVLNVSREASRNKLPSNV